MPSKPARSSFLRRLLGRSRRPPQVKSGGEEKEACIPDGTRILSCDDLKEFTNGFSDANFLGKTESSRSRVYRGKVIIDMESNRARDVIVEIWELKDYLKVYCCLDDYCCLEMWQTQISLLTNLVMRSHPNVAKVYGCCKDNGLLGLVYGCRARGTLRSMILDDSFTWCMRIKVALQVARLLTFLHAQTPPLIVRNLEPSSILLDMDFNPVVFGFGVATGGTLGQLSQLKDPIVIFSPCYTDPMLAIAWRLQPSCDVYSFGALLLTLITKSHDTANYTIRERVKYHIPPDANAEDFSPENFSLGHFTESAVQRNFLASEGFHSQDGTDITELAVECTPVTGGSLPQRPEMSEVVNRLEHLLLVQELGL